MRRVVLISLISFVFCFAATVYVNSSGTDTIFKGCPVGADTGITTVVTESNVGNATDTATIADSLKEPGIRSESDGLSYFLFRIHYGVSSSVHDTLDRFVWIRTKDQRNVMKSLTVKFDSAKTIDTTIRLVVSKLTRVIFRGRVASDSFGIYVENFPSVVPINETTQFSHQFAGLAQETILPRRRGAIGRDTIMDAYLPAGTRPGYMVTPGAGIRTCKVSSSLPDSGWVIGQTTQYQSSAGIRSIICRPYYRSRGGGGSVIEGDSARVAANSYKLQGKDTTALWNAKTLQGNDTTTVWQRIRDSLYAHRISDSAIGTARLNGQLGSYYRPLAIRSVDTVTTATPRPNVDQIDQYDLTALATTATFAAPAGTPTNGQRLLIRIKDDGTPRSLLWNNIYQPKGIALPATTVGSKCTYIAFLYNSTISTWDCVSMTQEQ